MKRLGLRWAAGMAGVGAALGAAWVLAVGGGVAVAHGSQDGMPAAGAAITAMAAMAAMAADGCDDACVRSRGAAALLVLSQRPPQ